jgi:AcrR family transcriptional regulator
VAPSSAVGETGDGAATRRSKGEQRARQREASRRRLLDAAFQSLIENGYSGTTTAEIGRLAGLSNGALFNYFETKDDLIVAAVSELVPGAMVQLDDTVIDAVHGAPRPVRAAIELVWMGMFAPVAVASAELYAAARTSPRLAAALAEVEPAARHELEQVTVRLFPELAGWDGLPALVTLVRSYVFGAATAWHALGDQPRFEQSRALLVEALEPLIAEAATRRSGG